MNIQYLEIVTPEVDATCAALAKLHAVTFSEPVPALGNARTATLAGGGITGVRAPMHESEEPELLASLLKIDVSGILMDVGYSLDPEPYEPPKRGAKRRSRLT